MFFNSLIFLGFITVVFLVYPRLRLRGQNVSLLVASYVFYGYWDWRFNFLLLISTVVNFWVGQRIDTSNDQKQRKLLLFISVAVNLGILGFFKYFNFFIDSAGSLLLAIGFEPHLPVLRVILPVGISFYTFQTMSYTIDIYRGKLEPTENFIDFALFVSFFPQLVAGPIERAKNLLPQISKPRHMTRENVLSGLNLVLLGFFKKVAIADTLAPIVENIFASPEGMSSGQLWTGVYAFTFQIYGDFSGYTDIARGIARILGFELMENFNAPYLSRNITEFWRRWHISLSSWLKDYLYIPLGGNRRGRARTYTNLTITMFLGGLWHGAAWNFGVWGLLHGIYLAGHRMILREKKPDLSWPGTFNGWAGDIIKIFLTFHLVALTWVLFRSPDFPSALVYLKGLFRFHQVTDLSAAVLFAGSLMIALDVAQTWSRSHTWLTDRHEVRIVRYSVAQLLFVSVLTASIAHIQTITPFIYFQF
jgi:D-alanyl-lipoteichoic acid acyltransferase DltB (MBOAT superfamily)